MANFKRKKPKQYLFIDCCRAEASKGTGNHKWRCKKRDLRQSQMYASNKHNPWRYRNVIDSY